MAPVLVKSLNRLSREGIIDLALLWLEERRLTTPYLLSNRKLFETDEEDYLHAPAESIEALRSIYRELRQRGQEIKKQEVIDRIVDGDWRRGLSLQQHASIDFAHLEQNDTALKWSALRLVPLGREDQNLQEGGEAYPSNKRRRLNRDGRNTSYPQISAQTFLTALKAEMSPLVKAHYHIHRMQPPYNLTVIRLYITPDAAFRPRASAIPRRAKDATDGGRVMYIALPDSCPYVYVSLSGSYGPSGHGRGARDSKGRTMAKVDMATMKKLVLEAIPKALSRPQERWALESTKLTAKSLRSICELRGNHKPGTGGGAYSIFTTNTQVSNSSPVDVQVHRQEQSDEVNGSVQQRFGPLPSEHYAPLDRIHVRVENLIPKDGATFTDSTAEETNDIGLTFSGSDVFLGLRKLAEMGQAHMNLDKTPAWMTGELGVSSITA
ncbi:hypothetical protein A1O1_07824 [Capronia coronata CBS 617.96]|uniref:CHL4 family chromosome segregation protein n=1 Tax=Capronia coronata CBS 617.96 TaxID=1182541 RepID=W9YHJ8_9EURO|nr:uncharacterized protein A1O1_07824 [Capronia coronata CBS 617.96]EXJ81759.1 hypothetical protein A1O1_07824 [Capronia coronata CBS 617.96]